MRKPFMTEEQKIKIKQKLHPLDFKMRLAALFVAIVIWLIVATAIYPERTVTFRDVPVSISLSGTLAEKNNLRVVRQDVSKVDVELKGSAAAVGNLKMEDLTATVDTDAIDAPGEYTKYIKIPEDDFSVMKITPSMVSFTMDRYVTQIFDVTAEAPNIKAAAGYVQGEAVPSPRQIEITGPESQISKITRCVVQTDKEMTDLTSSYQVTASNIILYNGTSVLDTTGLEIDKSSYFTIDVPIYAKKTLPFEVKFTHVPSGFPIEEIPYTIEPAALDVAVPSSMEGSQSITLPYIDLQLLSPSNAVQILPVELPEGFLNTNGIDQVTVTFDLSGFSTKTLEPKKSNIQIINGPSDYTIVPGFAGMPSMTFVGKQEILDGLTADDVVVQLDMSQVDPVKLQAINFSAPVSILVPNKGCVWALDSYTMMFIANENPGNN